MGEVIIFLVALVAFYIYSNKNTLLKYKKKTNNSTHYSNRDDKFRKSKSSSTETHYKIEKFVYEKLAAMKKDYETAPYIDKFKKINNHFSYIFENGDILQVKTKDDEIHRLDFISKNKYGKKIGKTAITTIELTNIILNYYQKSLTDSYHRNATQSEIFKKKILTNKYTKTEQKQQEIYYKLMDVYNSRKYQLDNLDKNDNSKKSLENELLVVKRKIKLIKPKTGL